MPIVPPQNLRAENERLSAELAELRLRLEEAEQAIEAIRTGQVESLVIEGPNGPRIFSLEGADYSYRVLVEAMNEGAATFGDDGTILYANGRFAEMLDTPLERVMGNAISRFLPDHARSAFEALVREADGGESRGELELLASSGKVVPAYLSVSMMKEAGLPRFCLVAADLRPQKRSEEIIAAERLARSVLEQAAEAIVMCDAEGRIVRASRAAAELSGCNPLLARFDEVFPLVVSEADHDLLPTSVFTAAIGGRGLRAVSASMTRPDGSIADVLASANCLRAPDERPIGCVVTMVDVTAHRRAEEALRAADAKLRMALAASRMVAWSWDIEADVVSASEGFETIFGQASITRAEEAIAMIHPEDRARHRTIVEAALREGRRYESEFRVTRPDAAVLWVQERAEVQRDERGKAERVVGIDIDVTERKQVELEIARARDQLELTLDSITDGYYALDSEWRFVRANRVAEEHFGVSEDQLVGQEIWSLLHVPPDSELRQRFVRARASGQSAHFEAAEPQIRLGFWAEMHLYPRDGGVLEVYYRDISERKQAEQALRDADRRKTQFLAMLSHELRNPLAPIMNGLFILDRAVPGGDQARRAQAVIDRQVGQLSRLVDDLLDVTRITRDKIQLQRQQIELNELVRRTIDDYRALFERSEVSLELELSPGPVYVNADWNRLAQVIGNLLQNAAKFTGPKGKTRVSVSTDPFAARAIVRVADTGVGMAPELLDRLFEPFSQGDETLDRSRGGLGLGLALVKGLVELHGGDVSAHSRGLGRGAEFVIRLPLDLSRVDDAAPEPRSSRKRRRVLIIEDNVDAAESLSEALALGEHEVVVAYDGPEGLEKARELVPDVVLCDIGLPGMDGYEVARAIRADAVLKRVFLVALTGYAMPEDRERAAEAGFHRHIAKPPTIEKLEALLAEAPQHSVMV